MKKGIFILFAIIAVNVATAQDVHFGLKGGLNFSNLTYKYGDPLDYKVGFHVGGLAHIHVSRHFAIQPEIMYSNQGGEETIGNTDYKYNLNYINIPVLAQYMFGDGFRLETGPQLGFLVGAKSKYNTNEINIKNSFKSTDFSWAFGLGYVGHQGLGFDARWNVGASDINKISTNPGTFNNNFQLGLFYQWPANNYGHTHTHTHRR